MSSLLSDSVFFIVHLSLFCGSSDVLDYNSHNVYVADNTSGEHQTNSGDGKDANAPLSHRQNPKLNFASLTPTA